MKQWKNKDILIPAAGLWLTLVGMHTVVCTALESSTQYPYLLLLYGAVSLVTTVLVCMTGKWSCLASGVVLAGGGVCLWRNRELVRYDMGVLAGYINRRNLAYTGQELFPESWCQEGELGRNLVLVVCCVALGIYISLAVLKLRSKFMAVVPIVLLYCAALLLGQAPGQIPALFVMAGMALLVMWIAQRQRVRGAVRWKSRNSGTGRGKRYAAGLLVLLSGIGMSWYLTAGLSDIVFQDVGEIQSRQRRIERDLLTKVEKSGQYLRGFLGVDGGGTLSNAAPHYQDKVVFEVTVEKMPQQPLYLRGFVGEVYHRGKWKASEQTNTVTRRQKKKIWKGTYCDSQYLEFLSEEKDISIRYTNFGRRSKYLYLPYNDTGEERAMDQNDKQRYKGAEDDELALYQDLADSLTNLYYEIDEALVRDVQAILKNNAVYSLNLETLPANRDYAENFLFYSQQGYCEHFATAGTLLLRNMHQYARYVTGYRVSPDSFQENPDGTYTAEVLDSSAHAWCDVWAENRYWMPQEMTPSDGVDGRSYSSVAQNIQGESQPLREVAEETAEPQNTPVRNPVDVTDAPETAMPQASASPNAGAFRGGDSGTGDSGSSPGRGENLQIIWNNLTGWQRGLIIAGALALVGILFGMTGRYYRKRRKIQRMAYMRAKNRSGYIRLRLGLFLDRLHHAGAAVEVTMPEQQWISVLEETMPEQIDAAELETAAELIRRAAYSREKIMEGEVDWFDAYCGKIEGSLTGRFRPYKVSIGRKRAGKTRGKHRSAKFSKN